MKLRHLSQLAGTLGDSVGLVSMCILSLPVIKILLDNRKMRNSQCIVFYNSVEMFRFSTTMWLKYPLKKFDSQWAFGMILLPYLVKIAIYAAMHHVRCLAT